MMIYLIIAQMANNLTSDGRISSSFKVEPNQSSIQSLNGVKVLYIYADPWDTPSRLQSLGASVYQVHVNSLGNISADSLCKYDVVMVDIHAVWSLGFLSANLQSYVSLGGGYWINQPNMGGNVPTLPPGFSVNISSEWWNCGTSSCQQFTPAASNHPITSGLNIDETSGDYDIQGSWGNNWTVLIIDNSNGPNDPTLMVGIYGAGRLAYTDHCLGWNCVDPGTNNYLERVAKWVASGTCGTYTPVNYNESAKLPGDNFEILKKQLFIKLINTRSIRYDVYNVGGRILMSKTIGLLEPGQYSFDLRLKPGFYVIKIYFDSSFMIKSFVIK